MSFSIDELEALPDVRRPGARGVQWTKEMDSLLLSGWNRKYKADVAKLLGVSEGVARKRYRYLKGE